jgi:hypothetical protein
MRLKSLIIGCVFLAPMSCLASDNAAPGFLEGHLRILAFKDVELAEGNPAKFSGGNYAEFPLIILSGDGKKEIARVTADKNGNYRVALPPGELCSRCPRPHAQTRPRDTPTVHGNFKSDRAHGHEH